MTAASPPASEPPAPVPVELIRPALEVAWLVARAGLAATPPVPPPRRLRPLLGFARLPVKGLAAVREVVDGDAGFRARVAATIDEAATDRASWLWLTRPEGWADELEALAERARLDARDAHESKAERSARRRLEAAEAARARAEDAAEAGRRLAGERLEELARERQGRRAAEAEVADLRAQVAGAERAAAEAVAGGEAARRRAAEAEAAAAGLRERLAAAIAEQDRLAAALTAASADLAEAQEGTRRAGEASAARTRLVGEAVADAADAAAALGAALARAGLALSGAAAEARRGEGDGRPRAQGTGAPGSGANGPGANGPGADGPGAEGPGAPAPPPATAPGALAGTRAPRRPVPVPHGLFADSVEVADFLVRQPDVLLLVDGYNVSLNTWPGVGLADQRLRLTSALGELAARAGTAIHVVFDASAEEQLPPPAGTARRLVRVGFSDSGEDADEVLIDLAARQDPGRPVVVATDDRRVRTEAERLGANTISVAQLLGVLGRRRQDR